MCGCWLLARSFLSFFSCFQFVRNFLRLSRLPLIAPCFQESRDDGHFLISGWLLISNHEPLLECFPPIWSNRPPPCTLGQKVDQKKHWVHLLRWSLWVSYRIHIFEGLKGKKSLCSVLVCFYYSISKVVSMSMLVIMMSVLCQNNYLGVLATPLVILETGESLGTPDR